MKKTVVIVEDDPGLRSQLEKILQEAPEITWLYSVASAEEALERIPKNPPDVVLLDVKLPGMSGIDCLPLLKQKVPTLEGFDFNCLRGGRYRFPCVEGGS